jgi:hypothetical protein
VINAGKLLIRGSPEKQVTGQAASLPNTRLAGVSPVLSWVDALKARRRMGILPSQSLWCGATTYSQLLLTIFIYRSIMPFDCGYREGGGD